METHTITVTPDNVSTNLQAAPAGSTLVFSPGVYRSQLTIDRPLVLIGQDFEADIVFDTPHYESSIVLASSDVTLRDMRISSLQELGTVPLINAEANAHTSITSCAVSGSGSGIWTTGKLIVSDSSFTFHSNGSPIFAYGGRGVVEIANVTISGGYETGISLSRGAKGEIDRCLDLWSSAAGRL
jgi:hypothetical protein